MEYHKIQSLFKRDPSGKKMLFGEYALPEFEYLAQNRWVFTEKVDGTNIRVIIQGGRVAFGGKTDNAQIPAKLFTRLQERFLDNVTLPRLLDKFPAGAVLYGEGYGAGIQSGGNYRPDQDFVLFDVLVDGWWLDRFNVAEVANYLGIKSVPIVGLGTLAEMVTLCEKGFQSHWGHFRAEGVVAKPLVELKTRSGERVVTKLKCKDFTGRGWE
jgi:hypothetical protein